VKPENLNAAKAVHRNSSEYNIIPGNPYAPAHQNYHLHEEANVQLSLKALKPLKSIWFTDDHQTKEAPAIPSKTAFHE
jgi:hypothetical protein